MEGAIEYPSLIECIRQRRPETLAIRRTVGLGDLIMLMAAARALLRDMQVHGLKRIVLIVRRDWFEWARDLSDGRIDYAMDRGVTTYPDVDIHYDANSCLSLDHRGEPWCNFHRVGLYAQSWGYADARVA